VRFRPGLLSALPLGVDDQNHRPFHLFGEIRIGVDLRRRRAPLLDVTDGETAAHQGVERGADRAVVLDHALGQPIRISPKRWNGR
jgi:hypothetical protein